MSSAVKSFIIQGPCYCAWVNNNFGSLSYILGQLSGMNFGISVHFLANEWNVSTVKLLLTTSAQLTLDGTWFFKVIKYGLHRRFA